MFGAFKTYRALWDKKVEDAIGCKIQEHPNYLFYQKPKENTMSELKPRWTWLIPILIGLMLLGRAYGQHPIQNVGQVDLPMTVVNISNYTGPLDQQAFDTGWGLPIVQQLSITREDQVFRGLLHTNTWNYGFSQGYTFNQIGAQTSFEMTGMTPYQEQVNAQYGIGSPGAITRPLPTNPW